MARPKLTLARLVERCVFNPGNHRHCRLLDECDSVREADADALDVNEDDRAKLLELVALYRQAHPSNGLHRSGNNAMYRREIATAVAALIEQGDDSLYERASVPFEGPVIIDAPPMRAVAA